MHGRHANLVILMPFPAQFASTTFGLGAVLSWGISDFLGGYTSRSANSYLITAITNGSGLVAIAIVCMLNGAPLPARITILWALAAGASGGTALAVFYRALAAGNMGLTAPVTAILSAAIPAVFGVFTQGWPKRLQIAGFILAGIAIWLIARSEQGFSPRGIMLAVISGVGFAGFYLCMGQAGDGSAVWLATASRFAAFVCTAILVLARKSFGPIQQQSAAWAILAGCLDVSGTVLFVRARQTGRLDAAVVLTSLYPVVTVLLARMVLKEQFTRWKTVGMLAALAAVPLIAS
jgi:drug/metabolite transporter (DMT)-like permease